jgi:hypothetical protein
MNALIQALTPEDRAALQREFSQVEPTSWVTDMARRRRWADANQAFLRHERERGAREMTDLMAALDARRPVSPAAAADLIAAAVELYGGNGDTEWCVERLDPECLRISVTNCPVIQRLESNNWRGVTACGSWHRRRGWYDAMGIYATDSILAESKWGDAACEALIDFSDATAEARAFWSRPSSALR